MFAIIFLLSENFFSDSGLKIGIKIPLRISESGIFSFSKELYYRKCVQIYQKLIKFARVCKILAKTNYDIEFKQLVWTNWCIWNYCSLLGGPFKGWKVRWIANAPSVPFHLFLPPGNQIWALCPTVRPLLHKLGRRITLPGSGIRISLNSSLSSCTIYIVHCTQIVHHLGS